MTQTAKKVAPKQPRHFEHTYRLIDLPSSQHRAGLAGLIHVIEWMKETSQPLNGHLCIDEINQDGATISFDQQGLRDLLQSFYASDHVRVKSRSKWNKKTALEEGYDETDDGKKTKYFVYEVIKPRGAFLQDLDQTYSSESNEGLWVKLWRDMLWQTVRGVPAQRNPYDNRVGDKPFRKDADSMWEALTSKTPKSVQLASTYLLGAQSVTSEQVPFKDEAPHVLLLHFWPVTAQVYVAAQLDKDLHLSLDTGYVFVIPDISNLERFCQKFKSIMHGRPESKLAYLPRQAVIDLPAEGALHYLQLIERYLSESQQGHYRSIVLGADVIHVQKQGNNINVCDVTRLDPSRGLLRNYGRLKETYTDHLFLSQRLANLIKDEPHWFDGFDLMTRTRPIDNFFRSYFQRDVIKAFEHTPSGGRMNEKKHEHIETVDGEEIDVDALIYRLVRRYVEVKTSQSQGKKPGEYGKVEKLTKAHIDWNDERARYAKKAFLAIRGRPSEDFVSYFTGSICSVNHGMSAKQMQAIARQLREPKKQQMLQNITLLALSAAGAKSYYAPQNATSDDA